ncbi:DNA mismatch repair endonuclease MutL [Halobacterium rubrum]|uniref:DNA mismatch repair endonuclease MutL n=1 Tax=Halobacterium TaxID=2239 RepID=UPI001EFFB104|nr:MULTISPECIES: DNA mismatch repair endonuclease MutL [Halobacterium]MDH5020233.1 DNA mismatch repair endonuclease MutL [Halobacterium rubrum]
MSDDGGAGGAGEEAAGRIAALDDATVAQIAAGEVVERPASVVKELVENSLDAGASSVDVSVDAGGTDRVVVADDGRGMTGDDLRVAVRQHTTSKLEDADGLDGVATLGFRGEALYTIGSVSQMTVTTRPRDAGDSGARITVDHGDVGDVEPAGRPAGTTVEVDDLFGETPARRKYLKRAATEFGHVNRAVTRYALANPDVAVSLTHDGREVFATTGTGDVRDAALAVYGREVAQSLREVDAEPEGGSVRRVHGYVSDPEVTRSTREYLATFVNGRAVTDTVLREAVLDGYGGQLAPDRYPFAVLFVDCDGVDANVHPRKLEVRFEDEAGVRAAVESAVRDALLDAGLVRSGAPRGASKPGDTEISPERTTADADAGVSEPEDAASRGDEDGQGAGASGTPGESSAPEFEASGSAGSTSGGSGDRSTADSGPADATREHRGSGSETRESSFDAPAENARLPTETSGEGPDETGPAPERESLPDLRVLGQLHGTYVVAEADDGLVLVDQHAADERVHYERLRARLDGTSQALVAPVELELTAGEAAVFESALGGLRELGFDAELAGRTARVTAVPAVLSDALDPELARDVLSAFLADAGGTPVADAADALLADLACSPAVKGNTSLTEGSVVDLLDELDACENPYACPHGRPTVVEVDGDELAERFERDYPGHAGRRREDAGN